MFVFSVHIFTGCVPSVHSAADQVGESTKASSPRRISSVCSDGGPLIPTSGKAREHTIDCGDVVWGLAFGSSVPEKQSRCVNIEWHRFQFGQDQLLLATGLSNGRIKIWDAYTGEDLKWSHVTGACECTRAV